MAKPKFYAQHFIVCQDAQWMGMPGPKTLRILEGVGYAYQVPANAECPELDLWVYMRLLLSNNISGRRRLEVDVRWLDANDVAHPVLTHPLGEMRFRRTTPVTDTTFHIGRIRFLNRGRYEFRLKYRYRSRNRGVRYRVIGRDYILIE